MKYFTRQQIEEIRTQLATQGIKDTELPDADVVSGDEVVAIVQDGVNKKISISELFLNFSSPDVLENIVKGEDGKSAYEIWLEQPGNAGKTVAQFLASLKGQNGTNGTNGTNGANGTSAGFGTPTATVGTDASGQPKCVITASGPDTAKVFNFAFKNIGSGSGGDDDDTPTPEPGEPGRSMISADLWFKLSSLSSNINPPDLSIENPATAQGGNWSKTASNPTEQQQYLWCFMQFNYDKALDNGKTYSRSGSWIARRYNSDTTSEYNDLRTLIDSVSAELSAQIAAYAQDLTDIYTVLQGVQNQISGEIKNRLDNLTSRLAQIEGTDVTLIAEEGLWGVLTSYNDGAGKKAFSDLVLDATRANAMISTGSAFFHGKTAQQMSADLNIDGLDARIKACATKQEVEALLSSELSIEAGIIQALVAKAHSCWKKNGVLYRYDLLWSEFWGSGDSGSSDDTEINFYDYEQYMEGEGYTLVVVVDEFSNIKQTADSLAASVYGFEYMWQKSSTGELAAYDAFETEYDESGSALDYEAYVVNKGYVKVKTSSVLSNVTQTSTEIKSMVGKVAKFWKKGTQYEAYAFPADGDTATYEAAKIAAGWTLETYVSRMSVIDQTDDKIELAVLRSNTYWVSTTLTEGEWYCVPYDTWYDDYVDAVAGGYSGTYEQFVGANHSTYQLKNIDDAITRIQQNATNISLSAAKIGTLETNVGTLQVTADDIKMGVGVVFKVWTNSSGDIKAYNYFRNEYNAEPRTQNYEQWVALRKHYTLTELDSTTLAGMEITTDKIWQGVGDGNGNVAAAITILKDADTDQSGSKIILDADTVEVDGTLVAQIANIADFVFQNQRFESTAVDDQGDPTIIIDGNTGEIEARGYSDTAYGHKEAHTVADKNGLSTSATWYASNSDNALGTLSAGVNNVHGFVEIDASTQGSGGRVDCATYISAFNTPALVIRTDSDETPSVRTAIDAEGNVSITGNLSVTGVINGTTVDVLNVISSGNASLATSNSGSLVYSSGAAYVFITSAISAGSIGFHFKLAAVASGSIVSADRNIAWTVIHDGTTSSSTGSSYTVPSAGVFEFIYVGTKNTYPEVLVIY